MSVTGKQPLGMSVEELTRRPEWMALSPTVKRILSLFFGPCQYDMTDAVATFHNNQALAFMNRKELSRADHEKTATDLLVDPNVQSIISLYFGRHVSQMGGSSQQLTGV